MKYPNPVYGYTWTLLCTSNEANTYFMCRKYIHIHKNTTQTQNRRHHHQHERERDRESEPNKRTIRINVCASAHFQPFAWKRPVRAAFIVILRLLTTLCHTMTGHRARLIGFRLPICIVLCMFSLSLSRKAYIFPAPTIADDKRVSLSCAHGRVCTRFAFNKKPWHRIELEKIEREWEQKNRNRYAKNHRLSKVSGYFRMLTTTFHPNTGLKHPPCVFFCFCFSGWNHSISLAKCRMYCVSMVCVHDVTWVSMDFTIDTKTPEKFNACHEKHWPFGHTIDLVHNNVWYIVHTAAI